MAKPNRPPSLEESYRAHPKLAELAQLFRTEDPIQMVEVARALINAVSGREVLAMVTFQPGSGQARLTVWPHNASFDEVEAALDTGKRIVIEQRVRTELEGTKNGEANQQTNQQQPDSSDSQPPGVLLSHGDADGQDPEAPGRQQSSGAAPAADGDGGSAGGDPEGPGGAHADAGHDGEEPGALAGLG